VAFLHFLYCLSGISSVLMDTISENGYPWIRGRDPFSTVKCEVNCRFYCKIPFYSEFAEKLYQEWVLSIIKHFISAYGDDCVVFSFFLLISFYYITEFQMLNQAYILGTNTGYRWIWVGNVCQYFVSTFMTDIKLEFSFLLISRIRVTFGS
jgi:hypothetical protein